MVFEYRPAALETLQAAVLAAHEAGAPRVLLELDRLEALDAEAVRGLITLLRRTREIGGELGLIVSKPDLLRTLSVTALDRLFAIYETREVAA